MSQKKDQAASTTEAAFSLEDKAKARIEELEREIKDVESLIEKTKTHLRQLQEAYLIKLGELSGLRRLLGE